MMIHSVGSMTWTQYDDELKAAGFQNQHKSQFDEFYYIPPTDDAVSPCHIRLNARDTWNASIMVVDTEATRQTVTSALGHHRATVAPQGDHILLGFEFNPTGLLALHRVAVALAGIFNPVAQTLEGVQA